MNLAVEKVEPIATGTREIPGLPGVRLEAVPVFHDPRGRLLELYRVDEIPPDFKPLMAALSWSQPGVSRGPHQHVGQDDYFTFAGPSDFVVALWDARPGGAGPQKCWLIPAGETHPTRVYVPRGVVHGYKNVGPVLGLVAYATSLLYRGHDRKDPVDEIRHELNPASPYHRFPEV